jgi:hypothetical protein
MWVFAGTALLPSERTEQPRCAASAAPWKWKRNSGICKAPTTFGGEYLTYVLWAISPEGRATNLGEILVGGNDRSRLTATTDLQAFALIVTAEPYFAVRQPSNVVVLENVVRADTKGTSEAVNAKYELMERGGYLPTGFKFDPVVLKRQPYRWSFTRRGMLCALLSPRAPNSTPAESYQHATRAYEERRRICH